MIQGGYSNYKTANVGTADQGKLILLVYDWSIRHCKMAIEKLDHGDVEERNSIISKIQRALTELTASLNMEAGGDIAKNLYALYDYMNRRLIEANVKKDKEPVKEVLGYLTDLRSAWTEAIQKVRQEKATPSENSSAGLAIVG